MYKSFQANPNSNPQSATENLATFRQDERLGRHLRIIATVKNCFQVDKNVRQEAQRAREHPEIHGREKVRPFYYGLVAAYSLAHDQFSWDLRDADWSFSSLEPYCVDIFGNLMALCGGNYVELVDMESGVKRSLQHPWLRTACRCNGVAQRGCLCRGLPVRAIAAAGRLNIYRRFPAGHC